MSKIVVEDWSHFNAAVRRLSEQMRAPPPPPVTPRVVPEKIRPAVTRQGEWRGAHWFVAALVLLALAAFIFALIAAFSPRPETQTGATATPMPAEGGGTEVVVTNYTTFHRVQFHQGAVVTGWNFNRSGDAMPTQEYCYYELMGHELRSKETFNIETRPVTGRLPLAEKLVEQMDALGADWAQAAQRCRWHPLSQPAKR